jgi:hypothetical protein
MFGFERVFINRLFGDLIVGCLSYVLFETFFEGSASLANVIFSIRAGNLVNSWAKRWVIFILGRSKILLEGFEGIENGFDILFTKNFGYVISSSLDVRKRNES